jgi:outer membrane protein OmpA-like peptidoglycan-associated protein
MMKKLFLMLAFAGVSVAGMAQTSETPELKYSVATNSFWSNWFISADVAYSAWYSNEEKGNNFKKGLFEDFRRNLGASVSIGKWFTPGIGLRTKVNGIWGRDVQTEDASTNAFKYWNAQEQVMFNLSNLFCGYKESRVWNLIPYAGTGVMRNCSDNEYLHVYSIGLLNTWKLSKKWAVNFDLGFNISDDDFTAGAATNHKNYATSIPTADRYFTAELGLTYNLGKSGWNKTPDVDALKALSQSQIDALNAQLADEEAENARLKKMIADHKCPEPKTITVKEVTAAPVSVFFNIGKSKIASRKDLQNVKELANVAKDKDAKIVVTGYADSKTGSANFNQKLSQKRAETVKAELVKMGVKESNIEVVAAGGVNTLAPYSYNRRATVEIK